jgi:hypothetical protein
LGGEGKEGGEITSGTTPGFIYHMENPYTAKTYSYILWRDSTFGKVYISLLFVYSQHHHWFLTTDFDELLHRADTASGQLR